ncbi:MAG: hypothetical protein AB8B63_13840 [Granulosicoccus sp.]
MSTKQRPTFRCSNTECAETFGYPVNSAHTGIIIVTCPHCDSRSKVNLDPFRRSSVSVLRNDENETVETSGEFDFPAHILTESVNDDTDD